jgi:NAD-dependent dihydropyrimidine dehydrogenase PreA subunit
MIEIVDAERCTNCNICVHACPTNVFDFGPSVPVIARQEDCQTCFMCEAWCPEDALYVAPEADVAVTLDVAALKANAIIGSYRRQLGWSRKQAAAV